MKHWIFLLGAFGFFATANAQQRCGTDDRHELRYKTDQKYREKFVRIQQEETEAPQARIASGVVYKVPVVVHVLHLGTPVGEGPNISDEQVYSAIYSLNEAYRKTGTFAGSSGEDAGMEFCLAQKDPSGNDHSGINRINASAMSGYASEGITDANELSIKEATQWNPNKYYNIWVVTEIDNNGGGGGVQGFAYYPPASDYDGTIILYNAFGADPGGKKGYNLKTYTNLNTTLIHELGHAFNLRHTFHGDENGASCPLNANCEIDGDRVCDTPPHRRSQSNCVTGVNSCDNGNSTALYIHNFMDYSSEACQYEFTAGQVARMRQTFASSRKTLVSESNLDACGCNGNKAPISRIEKEQESKVECGSTTVQYAHRSINFPVAWEWEFPGGTPSSSDLENPPVVTYDHQGVFPVILTTTSVDGHKHRLTKDNQVTVLGALTTPMVEDFEGATFPPSGWKVVNPDGEITWIEGTASGNGTSAKAAHVKNYNYNKRGAVDDLISPEINLHGTKAAVVLSFNVSYTRYSTSSDSLEVAVSTDCGISWQVVYKKGGTGLHTSSDRGSSFAPSEAAHWRMETVVLDDYVDHNVRLRFRSINDYGGNIYVDDVSITCDGYEVPQADFIASATSVEEGHSVTLISTSWGTVGQYLWEFEEAVVASSYDQPTIQVSFLTPGLKTVKLTVTNPEDASAVEEKIEYIEVLATTTMLSDSLYTPKPLLYPNPADLQVYFKHLPQNAVVSFVNVFGQVVQTHTVAETDAVLDIQYLARGVYTVLIQHEKGFYTERLVVGQ